MIFESYYTVGIRDISKENEATNKAILSYFEDVACKHSDSVGFGIKDIYNTNVVWVLMDWKLKVIRRPIYGQTIKVTTWSRKIEKCHAYRDFATYDGQGNLLAVATSKWVLLEANTRKIQKVTEEIGGRYQTEKLEHVFDEELDKMNEPEKIDSSLQLKVRKTDIDINNHVNNLNYLDLAYEILPIEIYNKNFKNIRIMYKHQISPEDVININHCHAENKEVITINSLDGKKLHAIIELY